jgi:hypothetical protein
MYAYFGNLSRITLDIYQFQILIFPEGFQDGGHANERAKLSADFCCDFWINGYHPFGTIIHTVFDRGRILDISPLGVFVGCGRWHSAKRLGFPLGLSIAV